MTDRKGIDAGMLEFSKGVLRRWCSEATYDISEIEPAEFEKLAAWIAAYCINKENPAIVDRPKKCLWICGDCGRGKTALARILSDKMFIPLRYADDIDKSYAEGGMLAYDSRLLTDPNTDLIIDDVGAETLRERYGNVSEFPQLLYRLYNLWVCSGKLLIVTSNIGLTKEGVERLTELYGRRIADRLAEMFMSVRLIGQTNWRQRDRG